MFTGNVKLYCFLCIFAMVINETFRAMKREIKFRLWSNTLKVMYSPDTDIGHLWSIKEAPNGIINTKDGDILMQYTGLKDENGKEIYEGDVLFQKYGTRLNETIVVKYEGASFVCKDNEGKYSMLYEVNDFFEIIGNIHQNPELLTK